MSFLRKRCRKSKRSPNPYASRGLEKFALVSAELAEKRQQLSAQLGTPVSVLGFTLVSRSRWVPIIVPPTKKKAKESKSSALLITSDTNASTVDDSVVVTAAAPSPMNSVVVTASAPSPMNSAAMQPHNATNGREQSLSMAGNDDEVWPEVIVRTASIIGTVAGIGWAAKFSTTFGMTIATALASSVLLRKWHAETAMAMQRSISESPTAGEDRAESSASAAAAAFSSPKRTTEDATSIAHRSNTASSSPPANVESHLPMPPPVRISPSIKAPSKQSSPRSSEAVHFGSSPTRQRNRFKYKFLSAGLHKKRETLSAPSTPRVSNRDIAATTSEAAVFHIDKSTQQRELARWSSLVSERQRKEKAARRGASLTAVGLVIVLGGLFLGNITAIVGLICWWYALPRLRKAVGDKPFVRSHHHSNIGKHYSNSMAITATKISGKKTITGVSSGKYDLQSSEYKKKLMIMDGLLHRGEHRGRTRSNT